MKRESEDKRIMIFRAPELGEAVHEAELLAWRVSPGDIVEPGQSLMEIMTDKATTEIPAPFAGRIAKLKAQPGEKITVGQAILEYEPLNAADAGAGVPTIPEKSISSGAAKTWGSADWIASPKVKASPAVRQLAREAGVSLQEIAGSGPDGRVLIRDLASSLGPRTTAAVKTASAPLPPPSSEETRLPFQGVRRQIAERMAYSKRTIPHATYVDECDVTALVRLRESLREAFVRKGLKLTYLAFFLKAVALSLRDVPIFNSVLDEEAGEIRLLADRRIGIAVAAPNGLIVPILRDPDQRSIAEIAQEVERLTALAREGRLKTDDLRGGTFTVTSVGGLGGLFFAPIVNPPQVAIAGFGKIVRRPAFDAKGQVVPADLLHISVSFDHRVIDGADAAAFVNAVIQRLQAPLALLAGVA